VKIDEKWGFGRSQWYCIKLASDVWCQRKAFQIKHPDLFLLSGEVDSVVQLTTGWPGCACVLTNLNFTI